MNFECWAKYGNRWSYKGEVAATDSKEAAIKIKQSTGRRVLKIRPSHSLDKCFFYRIK